MQSRAILHVRFARRELFLQNFERQGPRGVLFVETARKLELSEPVSVLVEFPADRRSFRLNGRVVSRRTMRETRLPPGVYVEFLIDEARTLRLVLDHAEGKQVAFVDRRSKRMTCSCVVLYKSDQDFIREFADDIGEGGTFIRGEKLLPVGSMLECRLKPPGYLLGIKLQGRVAWVKDRGFPKGMGIEFLFENERQRNKIRKLVAKLAKKKGAEVVKTVRKLRDSDRFR